MTSHRRGFAADHRTGKRQVSFRPSDEQIQIACRRIIEVIHHNHGILYAVSIEDAVGLLCRLVYNRGCQLGRYKGNEFQTTIRCAFSAMMENGQLVMCDKGVGTTVPKPRRRSHHQKYRPQKGGRRVA